MDSIPGLAGVARAQPTALGARAVAATLDPSWKQAIAHTGDSLAHSGVDRGAERDVLSARSVVVVRACSDGDGDLAPDPAGRELAHGFRHLVQWIRPVDPRRHLTGVDEAGEPLEVAGPLLVDKVCEPLLGDS